MDLAADIAITEDEFWAMLPREFSRRVAAYRKRAEREADLLLDLAVFVANHLVVLINKPMAMGQKAGKMRPHSKEKLRRYAAGPDGSEAGTKEEFEEMMERIYYIRRHGTRTEYDA